MTLFELARELFTYLVRFREKAPSTAAPPLPEVRRDLLGIFTRMDNQAKRDPLLMEPYHQVHYALVALADEIVLTSGWEHSPAWRQALLEERFYNTQQAGSHFFELAKNLDHAPQDVVAIFYLCLALGFSGRYAPADHELAEVKERLLTRLPSKPRIMEEPPRARLQKERRLRGWLWSSTAAAVLLAAVVLGWNQWQAHQAIQLSVAPAPASKPAPDQAQPDRVQQAAAPAKLETSPAPKAEPPAQPEPAAKAKAEAEPQTAPKPAPQPNVATAAAEAPEPKASEPPKTDEAATPSATKAKAQDQPAQTPQAPPTPQASAPAPAEGPKAAAAPTQPKQAEVDSAPKTAPLEKSYRVRMGVYVGPIQSGRFAEKLTKAGFPATIEKLDRSDGKILYVVSITPLASLAEAERVQSEIKLKFDITGVIKEN